MIIADLCATFAIFVCYIFCVCLLFFLNYLILNVYALKTMKYHLFTRDYFVEIAHINIRLTSKYFFPLY